MQKKGRKDKEIEMKENEKSEKGRGKE